LKAVKSLVPVAPEVFRVAAALKALTTELPVVLVAAWVTVMVSPLPVAAAAGAKELAVMVWISPVVAVEV